MRQRIMNLISDILKCNKALCGASSMLAGLSIIIFILCVCKEFNGLAAIVVSCLLILSASIYVISKHSDRDLEKIKDIMDEDQSTNSDSE